MRSAARFLLSSDPTGAADQSSSAFPFHSNVILTFAALLCALICALGLAFVARCAWLRRSLAAHADRPLLPALPLIPRKGIKQKTLRALPTLSFAASSSSSTAAPAPAGVELVDCAICLAEFACGDLVRVLPQCGHGFHAACVDTWLGSNASCPSCRRVVVVPAPPRSCRKASMMRGSFRAGNAHVGCTFLSRFAADSSSPDMDATFAVDYGCEGKEEIEGGKEEILCIAGIPPRDLDFAFVKLGVACVKFGVACVKVDVAYELRRMKGVAGRPATPYIRLCVQLSSYGLRTTTYYHYLV
ncbi:hypothetical protein ZIOFF_003629 [Zingiber officinale]|uniref:RING-type domain-containing protein n=1 Tax=Zingiber officinale TaxID=94328 RepID=A0A8J5IN75_ZINOF|nr:hypothetical protein ZIOFF_003629 [Zingiber officinale]